MRSSISDIFLSRAKLSATLEIPVDPVLAGIGTGAVSAGKDEAHSALTNA